MIQGDDAAFSATWRKPLVDVVIRAFAVFGLVAYLPSVWLSISEKLWAVAIVDTVAYAALIYLHVARQRLSYRLRAMVVCGMFFALGVFLVEMLGPIGAGMLWLFGFLVLCALLFGVRGLAVSSVLVFLSLGAQIARLGTGFYAPAAFGPETLPALLISAANLAFLVASLVTGIAFLARNLEAARAAQRKAEAELQQAQKLEAIGTLAGGMAHDLNNALQPIVMCATLLKEDMPAESPAHADLDTIIQSARRARDLVRRVLTFSRPSRPHRAPLHIAALIEDAAKLFRTSILHVTVDSRDADDARVDADPGELQQLIANLVSNAAYALGDAGGTVEIVIRATTEVSITVRDTGSGMSAEVLARAFEPFFTTKSKDEGTGLGLSVVHRMVRDLGGRTWLESQPAAGTTAHVVLPLHSRVTRPSVDQPSSARRGHGEHVLVIDDEPAVLETAERQLRALGYEVSAFASPELALQCFKSEPNTFDAMLTDLTMPQMSGATLIDEVRKLRPGLAVVLATGYLDPKEVATMKEQIERVQKPYSPEDLASALRKAINPRANP